MWTSLGLRPEHGLVLVVFAFYCILSEGKFNSQKFLKTGLTCKASMTQSYKDKPEVQKTCLTQ